MNLRIADGGALVTFLHRTVAKHGTEVLSASELRVVEVDGSIFFVGDEPLTVGGPFVSLAALVRSEGIRRDATLGSETASPPTFDVFEWANAYFRIEAGGEQALRRYATLREALDG